MSDENNKCVNMEGGKSIHSGFTHDSVIVGYGRSAIVEFWLVKQSWGTDFAH